MEEIKDNSLATSKRSVKKSGALPWYFQPFLKSKLTIQDEHYVIGKPITINIRRSGETIKAYAFVYDYNFFLGASWGMLSGVLSNSFLKADKISSKILSLQNSYPKSGQKSLVAVACSVSRAGVFSWRIATRCSLSVICFELLERNIRTMWKSMIGNNQYKNCGHLVSLPVTMAVTAFLFPMNKCMRISSLFSLCLSAGLGGGLACGHILSQRKRPTRHKESRYS